MRRTWKWSKKKDWRSRELNENAGHGQCSRDDQCSHLPRQTKRRNSSAGGSFRSCWRGFRCLSVIPTNISTSVQASSGIVHPRPSIRAEVHIDVSAWISHICFARKQLGHILSWWESCAVGVKRDLGGGVRSWLGSQIGHHAHNLVTIKSLAHGQDVCWFVDWDW